jgi:hypothetical protein
MDGRFVMKKPNISTLTGVVCLVLSLFLGACGGGGGAETAAGQLTPENPGTPSGNPGTPPANPGGVTVSNISPSQYVLGALAVDSDVYIDRGFVFMDVPAQFRSLAYLQTANADKFVNAADAISFDVNGAVTVYVGYTVVSSALPAWLQSWTDSGLSIRTSGPDFRVYQKDFSAGQVVLGGNEMGFSMYTVLVTAQVGSGGGSAPTITGTPAASITQGVTYSFIPSASDLENDRLTFSIANKPVWASFDASSGELSGTPGAGDVNDYPGITITVSDGVSVASLPAFAISVLGTATGSAMLSWTAPTQNEDSSALTDLAGYKVRFGPSQGNYPNVVTINNSGVTTHLVENLTAQDWYFVVTAFDTSLNESAFSNFGMKTVTP